VLIDSHCHLSFPELKATLADVLSSAQRQNVGLFVTICTTLEEGSQLEDISTTHDAVYRTVGLHPLNVDAYGGSPEELKTTLVTHMTGHKVIAVGEIGLDYHYPGYNAQHQQRCFVAQLEAAHAVQSPVCIHTREAEEDTLAILSSFPGLRGVIHCFSGDVAFARKVLELGFFISLSGTITFPKATAVREAVRFAPKDRLLIETDAPFLAPIPHRGRPNAPMFLPLIAQKLADIRGMPLETIERLTTDNFFTLFTRVPRASHVS
ncbi:MAG: TatD family hydrolase, partial [Holosporales bacterium]|jgi:TatD DNase family protein|nr:TatD family hydrolase [Holosporales bacterium]